MSCAVIEVYPRRATMVGVKYANELTSPTSKVCVFSELFRYRKTEIVYFTL